LLGERRSKHETNKYGMMVAASLIMSTVFLSCGPRQIFKPTLTPKTTPTSRPVSIRPMPTFQVISEHKPTTVQITDEKGIESMVGQTNKLLPR
jgi:hypothetical protein